MTRANIWPRSPGAALTWLPPRLRRKLCEILVDTQWTDRGGGRKNVKQLLDKLTQMSEGSQGGVRNAAVGTQRLRNQLSENEDLWQIGLEVDIWLRAMQSAHNVRFSDAVATLW
jgi:hypothetical protein